MIWTFKEFLIEISDERAKILLEKMKNTKLSVEEFYFKEVNPQRFKKPEPKQRGRKHIR